MKQAKIKLTPELIKLISQKAESIEANLVDNESMDEDDIKWETRLSDRLIHVLESIQDKPQAPEPNLEANWEAIKARIESPNVVSINRAPKRDKKTFGLVFALLAVAAAAILFVYNGDQPDPLQPTYKGTGSDYTVECQYDFRTDSGSLTTQDDGTTFLAPGNTLVHLAGECSQPAYMHLAVTSAGAHTSIVRNIEVGTQKSILDLGGTDLFSDTKNVSGISFYVTSSPIAPTALVPSTPFKEKIGDLDVIWSDSATLQRGAN